VCYYVHTALKVPFRSKGRSKPERSRILTRYLSVSQVANLLQISKGVVYRAIRGGTLPAKKFGRQFRIVESDLEEWGQIKQQMDGGK
jgi:excisionase family DNA binding protein